jgi:hypothetical protein
MCLSTIWPRKRLRALQKKSHIGPIKAWKVVQVGNLGVLKGPYQSTTYKTGYQLTTARSGKRLSAPISYPAGFHVYAKLKDVHSMLDEYRTIPCLIWDIVAAGLEGDKVVYVARKMMLLC